MNENNIRYQLLNYDLYLNRLNEALKSDKLMGFNITKNHLGYTKYGYDISEYVIGNGTKDLFIVGGTHGSEIISVDFVTQLLLNAHLLKDYDPNLLTIHFIPNQNPEGFDITTQTLSYIKEHSLEYEGHDYYLRYRLDNLLNTYLARLNCKFSMVNGILMVPYIYIKSIKESFEENSWLMLTDKDRGVSELKIIEKLFYNLKKYTDFESLRRDLLVCFDNIKPLDNPYANSLIKRLANALTSEELFEIINEKNRIVINKSAYSRLYQEKFQKYPIKASSKSLETSIFSAYEQYNIPKGSQVKFDPNGDFVNLNKNRAENPGIQQIRNGEIKYGMSPANNVLDNTIGPIGMPCEDVNHFDYAIENKLLLSLINKSVEENRFTGVLLYHSTGGLIYSKPFRTDDNKDFFAYNERLCNAYRTPTQYKPTQDKVETGFGDLLRKTYPGVLLIELSFMNGNPIAPYGDIWNIYSTFGNNFKAVDELIKEINNMINKNEVPLKRVR